MESKKIEKLFYNLLGYISYRQMDFKNEQFNLGRLFAFMENLYLSIDFMLDFSEWIEKSMNEQQMLDVKINDDILREFLLLYTPYAGEIIYENQLYFVLEDDDDIVYILYVNQGYITIETDFYKKNNIIKEERK